MRELVHVAVTACVAVLCCGTIAPIRSAEPADLNAELQAYQRAVDRAIDYLRIKGQGADGSFSSSSGPGVGAVVTTGLIRVGLSPDDPLVAKSLKYL